MSRRYDYRLLPKPSIREMTWEDHKLTELRDAQTRNLLTETRYMANQTRNLISEARYMATETKNLITEARYMAAQVAV